MRNEEKAAREARVRAVGTEPADAERRVRWRCGMKYLYLMSELIMK